MKATTYTLATIMSYSKAYVLYDLLRHIGTVESIVRVVLMGALVSLLANLAMGTGNASVATAIIIVCVKGASDLVSTAISMYAQGARAKAEAPIVSGLKRDIAHQIASRKLEGFHHPTFNTLLNMSLQQPREITFFFDSLGSFISSLVGILGMLFILVRISLPLPVIVLAFVVPSMLLVRKYQATHSHTRKQMEKHHRVTYHLFNDTLTQRPFFEESQMFGSRQFLKHKFTHYKTHAIGEELKLNAKSRHIDMLAEGFSSLAVVAACLYIILVLDDGIAAASAIAIVLASISSIRKSLSHMVSSVRELAEGANKVAEIMDFLADETWNENQGEMIHEQIQEIRFENVSFSYENATKNAVHDLSFVIRSGDYCALVGSNGAGKTTLAKLICGIFTPTSGTIYYNGVPHTALSQRKIQEQFTLLYQTYGKYALSIQENITLGDTVDRGRLDHATALSGVNQVLEDCKDGLGTPLLPELLAGGTNLSIGQWQRIATARAFYKKCDMLILDEPSSALDPIAEDRVYQSIEKCDAHHIKIIISHRLSSMKATNHIICLAGGRLMEQGTFSDLLAQNGTFAELYHMQAARYTNG